MDSYRKKLSNSDESNLKAGISAQRKSQLFLLLLNYGLQLLSLFEFLCVSPCFVIYSKTCLDVHSKLDNENS